MQAETLKAQMNYSRGVQRGGRVAVEVGRAIKEIDGTQKRRQAEGCVCVLGVEKMTLLFIRLFVTG